MASEERPIVNVMQNIVDDVREIVRSEVRLARQEVSTEISKVKLVAPLLAIAAVAGGLAALFLCWVALFALSIAIPFWSAALVVVAMLGGIGGIAAVTALAKLRRVNPPERTIASVKENVEWIRERTR
jgi:hypothetical protein